jgi:hypothetical protein
VIERDRAAVQREADEQDIATRPWYFQRTAGNAIRAAVRQRQQQ